MSSYREHGFQPDAAEWPGATQRPLNWVEWTGMACALLGAAVEVAYLAGKSGWLPSFIDTPMPGVALVMMAIPLVNSRRYAAHDPAPERAAARRRWTVITLAICTAVIGAAVILEFIGA